MNFHRSGASLFVPDGQTPEAGLARVTHLGIGAHQDDLEFMAFHGIIACYHHGSQWFGGVTCTDGAGSARTGPYAAYDDDAMRGLRRREQDLAADIGGYGAMLQLDYPSAALREPAGRADLCGDLLGILRATRPRIVYTHNLADKHDTHVRVALAAIEAIRRLPADERPAAVHGCEVWRDLDWLPDADKIAHDLSGHEELAAALNAVFESQIAGGKRYDLGISGRRRANATFSEPRAVDRATSLAFAMDLTPLAHDPTLDIPGYVDAFIERFREDVQARLRGASES